MAYGSIRQDSAILRRRSGNGISILAIGPAHLRDVPVQIVLVQIKPVLAGDGMPDGIAGVRVQHHLGIAYRAGGEIHQAGIIAARFGAVKFGRRLISDLVVARPTLTSSQVGVGFNYNRVLNSRTLVTYLVKLGGTLAIG